MSNAASPQPNDPAWVVRAFSDLGLHEIAGPRHAARVLTMFKTAGHPEIHDDETAWCSAAMNTWMVEAGIKGTGALNARSWLDWGKKLPTTNIPRGAVLIFKRGNSSWLGHVTLCLADDGNIVTCIGGNQSDSVSIARYRKTALIGVRWPAQAAASVSPIVGIADIPSEETDDNPPDAGSNDAPVPAPTAPATTTVVTARTAAGTGAAVLAGGQVVATAIGGAGDVAEKTTDLIDKSGQIISTSKQVVTIPKPGFWGGVLHFVTSPEFVVIAVLFIAAMWALVWFIQRNHKPPGAE